MIRNLMMLLTLIAGLTLVQPVSAAPEAGDDHAAVDEHHDAGGHVERALMPNPSTDAELMVKEMVFTIIVFVIFFVVLSLVVWPKILGALKAREEKQEADLLASENAAKEAKATLAQYQQQLADARKESLAIIEQSKADAQRVAAQLKEQAQEELTQMRSRAEAEIKAASEEAIASIYEQAAGLATSVAGQILKRELDPAAHQALVAESLQQIAADRN